MWAFISPTDTPHLIPLFYHIIKSVKQLLEEGAYVIINFGAHPLCDGTMMDSLEQFDDWMSFVVGLLEAEPSHRHRLAWLGSYPRPVMGYYHMGGT